VSQFSLPFNFFDLLAVAILVAGLIHGRKRGMTGELVSSIKWLVIVVVCAVVYRPVGNGLVELRALSLFSAYMLAYLTAAFVLVVLFTFFEKRWRTKLEGTDTFGRAEYYWGMAAGLVRASCMLMVFLALLNAPQFEPADVKAMKKYQNDNFGSEFFPTWHSVQSDIFEHSLVGPWIRQDLAFLLIEPTDRAK
jgi:uncharacterized membrane protein required for colicin V production